MSRSFWKGKRVLITGHTGFKGGWLAIWLQRLGAQITGYALEPPTDPSLFEAAGLADAMLSTIADVRDLDRISAVVSEFRPQIIFHMAAQALVRRSYTDPVETFASNVMGTVNVLEAARRSLDTRAIVNVTSDKCYENQDRHEGYREDEPMGGHDPYSSSKGCAELVASAYRRSFFSENSSLALASARAGNVIGGGDWAEDRLIPDIVRSFTAGEAAKIRNPTAIRPWQHVLEPLSGYLVLAERLYEQGDEFAEGWNFGPADDDAKPVEWLADKACELWDSPAAWSDDSTANQLHEAGLLRLNTDKARDRLDWHPKLNLERALEWTMDWYKCFERGDDVRALSEAQIEKFETGQGLS